MLLNTSREPRALGVSTNLNEWLVLSVSALSGPEVIPGSAAVPRQVLRVRVMVTQQLSLLALPHLHPAANTNLTLFTQIKLLC